MTPPRLFHGGVPGLRAGDVLTGGQARRTHAGCAFCEARASGSAVAGPGGVPIDGPSHRPDRVYLTADRDYARFYASCRARRAADHVAAPPAPAPLDRGGPRCCDRDDTSVGVRDGEAPNARPATLLPSTA